MHRCGRPGFGSGADWVRLPLAGWGPPLTPWIQERLQRLYVVRSDIDRGRTRSGTPGPQAARGRHAQGLPRRKCKTGGCRRRDRVDEGGQEALHGNGYSRWTHAELFGPYQTEEGG